VADGSEKRVTYPKIPVRNWWDLRRKFKQAFPRQVDSDYLASVLSISEPAARKNLIPPLRSIGLIDEDGKPTSLANDWRSDEHYSDVCKTIRERIYPAQLLDAFPPPKPDKDAVANWFFRNAGTGIGAAQQMASFYRLLCEADPSGQDSITIATAESGGRTKARKIIKEPVTVESLVRSSDDAASKDLSLQSRDGPELPSLHIDIQIHISADAKPEQIDQVFASMAKHLYGRSNG